MLPDTLDVMLTVGVDEVVIEIVIVFEVAVVAVGHCALEVMIQRTMAPLAKVEEVKMLLLVPTFAPLTCHW
jgi:hypothetical protein